MTTPTVWEVFADRLTPPESVSFYDWVVSHAGPNVWSKVQEICEAIEVHRRVAIYGCHSSSKTWTVAQVILAWIDNAPIGKRRAITTAPGGDQVKGGLWIELNRSHAAYGLPGRMTQTEWWVGAWQAGIGRKPADWAPTSFQGLKAEEVLVVADEATGLEELWEALESLASSKRSKLVAMGNPTDPNSTFAKICQPGSGWHVINIDGHDTPNWTGEPVPEVVANSLISKEYAQGIIDRYGIESPVYLSRVRGQWPEDASDGVIPFSWAKACQRLDVDLSQGDVELGMDVGASEAGDPTVIREMIGNKAGRTWETRSSDPEAIVGFAVQKINETGAKRIKIDVIGIGFGIAGWVEKEGKLKNHSAQVIKVNVAERPLNPKDRKRFKNKRAQMWWMGRELSQGPNPAWDLSEISEECLAQLIAPRYEINSAGQIVVEEKDEIRKRTGRSPDDAEALLLAAWKQGGPARASSAASVTLPS